ncbi:C2H2-type zinc finger protein [Stygiolobus caldivivus]|uniref:C2H2-type domain-containing protein n=1 Tax=Stygiolobus caldivivus TaxID=2824673 RepID=A0A8D5ZJ98_9CREN|nr:C2H2-type zinc finger protein [Stygiolobus caldivivus]BCU70140.1 hypothetical protein KN1_14370 [Stygiolobus caldivivus]
MGYRCPECKKVFDDFKDLRIHYRKSHMDGRCSICGPDGKKFSNIIRHYHMKTDDFPHLVVLCIIEGYDFIEDKKYRKIVRSLVETVLEERNAMLFEIIFNKGDRGR